MVRRAAAKHIGVRALPTPSQSNCFTPAVDRRSSSWSSRRSSSCPSCYPSSQRWQGTTRFGEGRGGRGTLQQRRRRRPLPPAPQDSVRLLAIENSTAFAKVMGMADVAATILPLTRSCAGDKSWRVRNNVARDFCAVRLAADAAGGAAAAPRPPPRLQLSEAMGLALVKSDLLGLFVKLLRDPEGEVRAARRRRRVARPPHPSFPPIARSAPRPPRTCPATTGSSARTASSRISSPRSGTAALTRLRWASFGCLGCMPAEGQQQHAAPLLPSMWCTGRAADARREPHGGRRPPDA